MRMLLHWVISALAVWITSRLVPGFYVDGAAAALIAAVVIGLVNATIGLVLKIITFPITILTLGCSGSSSTPSCWSWRRQ